MRMGNRAPEADRTVKCLEEAARLIRESSSHPLVPLAVGAAAHYMVEAAGHLHRRLERLEGAGDGHSG